MHITPLASGNALWDQFKYKLFLKKKHGSSSISLHDTNQSQQNAYSQARCTKITWTPHSIDKLLESSFTSPTTNQTYLATNILSRFMQAPQRPLLDATNYMLRHLQGTSDLIILLNENAPNNVEGYTDSVWAGDKEGKYLHCRMSTNNMEQPKTTNGGPQLHMSQISFAWRGCQGKYMAATTPKQIWIKGIKTYLSTLWQHEHHENHCI